MTETNPEFIPSAKPIPFKAETRQLLDILIHSLYTEREIFLRELISNSSDALTRMNFELLTNRNVISPEADLEIRITANPESRTISIQDSGIGMTAQELTENLGTIAHSGARTFMDAVKTDRDKLSDLIGQFGVGFYSAFMVADWIRVTSRSYRPDEEAATWFSTGSDTFTIEPAEKAERGTIVTLHLLEDADEFLQEYRLREIIQKHSNFVPFPIFLGIQTEQINRPSAIWRQNPREIDEKGYQDFYQQLTLDPEKPLVYTHMSIDAPVQMYAVLFVPSSPERGILSPRREEGLELYARKVLIQQYCRDLLPEYFQFVTGVVDSEDLPLNVSRETVQSNRVMSQLKKLITSKVIDILKKLGQDKPEEYQKFWERFHQYIKQGVATENVENENLYPLLRFKTNLFPDKWSALDDYIQRMKPDQKEIFYILGEDERSVVHSPHLDLVRKQGFEVLLLTDPLDSFVLLRLTDYQDHKLQNVAQANLEPEGGENKSTDSETEEKSNDDFTHLIERFKQQLGDQVTDVRVTHRLSDSPARLIDPEGSINPEMQRVYRMLKQDFPAPKKILEINPEHPILVSLDGLSLDSPLNSLIVEQIYEDALLIEGIHPDPASMISRIQKLMEEALHH